MKFFALLFLAFISLTSFAQQGWTWTELPAMPEPVANNAVVEAISNDTLCIYSFCGIDETKSPAGIHLKAWKYNTVSQVWSVLPDVPDANGGKIAAGASVVDNIIYVIGGYHVAANFSEVSSDKVHRFNPNTDSWLSDGSPIPVPIDDHVQAVWNSSWIYIITGWSNTGNVNDVQIYNPNVDQWSVGTATPNGVNYEAFGTSGSIIGDTIYYYGGVQGSFSFTANAKLRKGVIDPFNPYEISWSQLEEYPGGPGYRTAAAHYEDHLFWIGGAGVAYNFDGIAYNGTGGVEPTGRIATYYASSDQWLDDSSTGEEVMDLRGIGQVSPNSWIICGGMESNQVVSDKTFLLTYDSSVSTDEMIGESVLRVKNGYVEVQSMDGVRSLQLHALNGQLVGEAQFRNAPKSAKIELPRNIRGLILVTISFANGNVERLKLMCPE